MSYLVKSHRLVRSDGSAVAFRQTPNKSSGVLVPTLIVLHDTAGRLGDGSSVNWLCDPQAKASAHFVVDRDGDITQLSASNTITWHAGQSSYRGRPNVNGFSIGIEIENPGRMTGDDSYARAWYGKSYAGDEYELAAKTTKEHGSGVWMHYTEEQILAVIELGVALSAYYAIDDVTTHWAISPGRKVDTNPLFPLENVRGRILGRFTAPDGSNVSKAAIENAARTLAGVNQRRWPSFADNIIQVVPKGSPIEIIRSGTYVNNSEADVWHLASFGDHEGWIHSDYVALI